MLTFGMVLSLLTFLPYLFHVCYLLDIEKWLYLFLVLVDGLMTMTNVGRDIRKCYEPDLGHSESDSYSNLFTPASPDHEHRYLCATCTVVLVWSSQNRQVGVSETVIQHDVYFRGSENIRYDIAK